LTSFDALAGAEPSSSDRDLLAISRLLDTEWYQKQSSLPHGRDPVDHYLAVGWQNGIDPYNGFESDFLRPYYEASGHSGAPILTWLELSSMEGRRPPTCQREAEYLAARLKHTALFDEDYYRQTLRGDLDPALHYVLIGELIGYQPSRLFDPQFYLDLYEDIGRRDLSPLDHFIEHGTREGRRPLPVSKRLSFPPVCDSSRPTVLLLVHDASRTGAPVLGWNIVRALSHSTNVVSVIMHGGVLEECFLAASAAVVGPMTWDEWQPMEMRRVAARLVDVYHPLYAIANSIETSLLVPPLAALGVPSVALVHEFAAYTRPVSKIRDVLDWATHIVFPSKVVADAMFRAVPSSRDRQGTHVMPQGRSDLPGVLIEDSLRPDERAIEREIRPNESLDAFVVLGLGTVQYRKGVDLFLATAACARRMAPDLKLRFVWVGEGYDPDADFSYSAYLSEQIIQSDIGDMVVILGAVENLDPVYRCADVLFLSSRLDPQPNVGIDALTRGLPTVCFDGASGLPYSSRNNLLAGERSYGNDRC
jgi:glycosyltransferase involved in cell wall biosynthesis